MRPRWTPLHLHQHGKPIASSGPSKQPNAKEVSYPKMTRSLVGNLKLLPRSLPPQNGVENSRLLFFRIPKNSPILKQIGCHQRLVFLFKPQETWSSQIGNYCLNIYTLVVFNFQGILCQEPSTVCLGTGISHWIWFCVSKPRFRSYTSTLPKIAELVYSMPLCFTFS